MLHTPQGWVCIATALVYLLLAVAIHLFGAPVSIGRTATTTTVICLFWPLITFLVYVKQNLPAFEASWSQALYLAVAAVAPIGYSAWKVLGT
ncbi:MAG: hypothetical protein ACKVOX_07255 [Rhizobacter sp.]